MEKQRLPNDVIPINYELKLHPDLEAFTFQGKLNITAKVWLIQCTCRINWRYVHDIRAEEHPAPAFPPPLEFNKLLISVAVSQNMCNIS